MKHDFSNEAISAFKASISSCRTQIKDMRLSSEQLSFPLKNGIIYSILNGMEVDAVNKLPDLLGATFTQCEIMLDAVHTKMEWHDTDNAALFSDIISDMDSLNSILTKILSSLSNCDLEKNACFDRLKVDVDIDINLIDVDGYMTYNTNNEKYEYDIDSINELLNNKDLDLKRKEKIIKTICKILINIDNSNLSDEDKKIMLDILNRLVKDKADNYQFEIVSIYEKINGEIKINTIDKSSWTDYSEKRYQYVKYLLCIGWSETMISKYFDPSNVCASTVGAVEAFPQFGDNDCIRQGQFELCDLSMKINKDGTATFSMVAKQKMPACNGAVIVYDKDGKVVKYVKLERNKTPSDFIGSVSYIVKSFKGKDYAATDVNVTIPAGGFVEITDDPTIIEKVPLHMRSYMSPEEMSENASDYAENLSGGIPDLKDPSDAAQLYVDIAEQVIETVGEAEAKYWSEQEKYSGSFILYNM